MFSEEKWKIVLLKSCFIGQRPQRFRVEASVTSWLKARREQLAKRFEGFY